MTLQCQSFPSSISHMISGRPMSNLVHDTCVFPYLQCKSNLNHLACISFGGPSVPKS